MPITPNEFCQWKGEVDAPNRKPVISKVSLERYLTQQGFYCCYDDSNQSDIHMVRVIDRRIYNCGTNIMYNYLVNVLEKEHSQWLDALKDYIVLLFKPTIIQMKRLEPKMLRDTDTTSYIPFNNGVVTVTRTGVELKSYSELLTGNTYILNSKIIPRNIDLQFANYESGVWNRFLTNAVGEKGLPYLKRALGYMLHTHKDKSNAKIVFLSDSTSGNHSRAMGGSGKSLISYSALNELRNVFYEDGKSFNPKSTFKFQGLSIDNDICCIDDVVKEFNQKVIYNLTTGNFSSEEKYKARKIIDFQDSCKFIINGNYGISLDDDSDIRRTCIIGLTDYYNARNTPMMEFKHRFFSEWTGDRAIEYQYFYATMFSCIQMYLQSGMESYKYEQVAKKGTVNKYPDTLIKSINTVKHNFIGIANAMTQEDIKERIGNYTTDCIKALKSIMESDGYDWLKDRKRVIGKVNPADLYYFKKK